MYVYIVSLVFGSLGLQAQEPGWVSARQLEAGRRTITRYAKRGGKLWIRVFPDRPITVRPAETRMGAGKGSPDYWISIVRPGRILYELTGIPKDVGREALRMAGYKMPMKTKVIAAESPKGQRSEASNRQTETSNQAMLSEPTPVQKESTTPPTVDVS